MSLAEVDFEFDFGPPQQEITKERIEEMVAWEPRRHRLGDLKTELKAPGTFGNSDWYLRFPFAATFVPTYEVEFPINHIPFKATSKSPVACFTFLKDVDERYIENVRDWLARVSPFVGIRDCLCVSYALDYDREEGNPERAQTEIGTLRGKAKPYNSKATVETFGAADALTQRCADLARAVEVYGLADSVAAVPSRQGKLFDLPTYIAKKLASELGLEDLTDAVRTTKDRPELKRLAVGQKLSAVDGTMKADPSRVAGKTILLVDDLYQSGISMNYCGMVLLEQGATRILGMACEKTCRNDDNSRAT